MKKFIAPNIKEGIAQMRKELGDDAVILSTRNVKVDGSDDIIEIIAALDEQLVSRAIELHNEPTVTTKTPAKHQKQSPSKKNLPLSDKKSDSNIDSDSLNTTAALLQLRNDIRQIKENVSLLTDALPYRYAALLNDSAKYIYTLLRSSDFSDDEALRITGLASASTGNSSKDLLAAAIKIITSDLKIFPALEVRQTVTTVAFIGTTGGGKTTTITKLAAICKLLLKANILIVSADTYKVGGAEQLQTFASIAGIPFLTAYNSQELRQIIKQESKRDFIFIDTVGRSQQRRQHLLEIGAYLEAATPDITYLVQSATVSEVSFAEVLSRFAILEPSALILTKLDETAGLGGIISVLRRHKLPLAYFTTGQKIPDDIETARAERLAELVLPNESL
ncbi:MAG: flagellar biosynthesis protein FlhF [Ignavibacteria bacterium]|nr:flagellar biosynthesis protein FlhF [Ignavibacteria bacterium]